MYVCGKEPFLSSLFNPEAGAQAFAAVIEAVVYSRDFTVS